MPAQPGVDPKSRPPRAREKPPPPRGAGHAIVPERTPGAASRSRTMALPGSPGERDAVCFPGYEAGRRRAIGVVAALPASHARPRRWCDAGSPGRQCVTAAQKAGDEGKVRNHSSDRDRGRIRIRGRWNQPASVHHHRRRDAGASTASRKAGPRVRLSGPENPRAKM